MPNKSDARYDSEILTDIGICTRNRDNLIVFQNDTCRAVCPKHTGQTCRRCSSALKSSINGIHKLRFHYINAHVTDVAVTVTDTQQNTIFYILDSLVNELENLIASSDLTPREGHVARYILEMKSNTDIQAELGISHATLKTHINRIYQKVPQLKDFRAHISG